MKKAKKNLAIVLVIVMIMMTSVTAFADNAYLQLNEKKHLCQAGGKYDVYNFTSEEGGWYVLYTETVLDEVAVGYATDPYLCIKDSEDNIVELADDSMLDNLNCEIPFFAEPGEIYYIEIGNYNWEQETVWYNVYLKEVNRNSHNIHYDYDSNGNCDWCGYCYCGHACHEKGFFWNFANFFNRLFHINLVCECGENHW